MITEVKFNRTTTAIGRNGSMKCVGISIMYTSYPKDCIMIEPINTRGIGNAVITIPKEEIPYLCYILEDMLKDHYRVRMNKRDDSDKNQINGYLSWNGEIVSLTRGEAIKKARMFDGKIEKI